MPFAKSSADEADDQYSAEAERRARLQRQLLAAAAASSRFVDARSYDRLFVSQRIKRLAYR